MFDLKAPAEPFTYSASLPYPHVIRPQKVIVQEQLIMNPAPYA